MKPLFLFPYWCRYLGYILVVVHIPIVLYKNEIGFDMHGADAGIFNSRHVFFMLTTLLMAVGLFIAAFSKERIEDEQITKLRLDSLQWAVYVNFLFLIISLVFSTDTEHILFLNLLVPLVFFIIRFRWKIFQNNRLINE
ncbi:hypothetical protein SNE25_02805 [Mucilaginibacter sabulilitoris]|uniref:Uncharacterized protein n=1 Tax=Mucilaginibacter sabulilitoris TaxID=1173583 RepID=A0ABZ0TTF4_9SPHI|nr:hypothetical protein [Mucilaginibacter sabulilitoris]WPU94450.1 hypothetical protein SNE25_02805 [Mucilaginibacter sabulilitoris]